LIRRNDDWQELQQRQIEQTGFAPNDSRESAIVARLQPGAYTAVVSGKDGSRGTALVEVYDLDPRADSRLANLSTRGRVGRREHVMIGGFMVRGTGTTDLVVRALGPSLRKFGVNDPMRDPTLDVRNANGDSIAFNDDWSDDPADAAAVIADGFAPTGEREAALSLTFGAGDYTVIVSGKPHDSGIALLEIYTLP
jgi:hypothetical protein